MVPDRNGSIDPERRTGRDQKLEAMSPRPTPALDSISRSCCRQISSGEVLRAGGGVTALAHMSLTRTFLQNSSVTHTTV
jgi:hypothetical protein